jgi:hypothetical protein
VREYVEIGSGELIEKENLVEFHLLYSGQLHSGNSDNVRVEKHAIRKIFHVQLRHLWATHPNLREMAVGRGALVRSTTSDVAAELLPEDAFQAGLEFIGKNHNRNGFNFLPLVTKALCLRCALDILFLRREDGKSLIQDGDIDGRLKTLFDAMKMTAQAQDLPTGARPDDNENPFFCLLEDDSLISEVHVNTAPLLMLPNSLAIDKHDAYLQIGVRLNTTRSVAHSWAFV